jgi:hypothetical protein
MSLKMKMVSQCQLFQGYLDVFKEIKVSQSLILADTL